VDEAADLDDLGPGLLDLVIDLLGGLGVDGERPYGPCG